MIKRTSTRSRSSRWSALDNERLPPSLVMFTDDATAYRGGVMSNPDPYAQEPLTDEVLTERGSTESTMTTFWACSARSQPGD